MLEKELLRVFVLVFNKDLRSELVPRGLETPCIYKIILQSSAVSPTYQSTLSIDNTYLLIVISDYLDLATIQLTETPLAVNT